MTADLVPGAGTADTIPDQPAGPPWTYTVEHEAWYAATSGAAARPEVVVQHETYEATGGRDGCEWQFSLAWVDDRIRIDWMGFEECVRIERPDVFDALLDLPARATPGEVSAALQRIGFVDATERREPSFIPELPA